jgi:hypothetical protein
MSYILLGGVGRILLTLQETQRSMCSSREKGHLTVGHLENRSVFTPLPGVGVGVLQPSWRSRAEFPSFFSIQEVEKRMGKRR